MKLTIEEGPNGPMKETSRGTEVRGREGGVHWRVVMTLLGAWTQRSEGGGLSFRQMAVN